MLSSLSVHSADPLPAFIAPTGAPLPPRDALGFFHPADDREVAALVAFARARRRTVRVRGAALSAPAAIYADARLRGAPSDAIEMVLDRITSVDFDDARRQVTVGAGCTFGPGPRGAPGLCAQLEAHGWALPNLGGVTGQTVAGFLATGAAGGSARFGLAERVVALRLVDGRGRVHLIHRDEDPERFAAVGVALGLCGVVTAVTLACEPRYDVMGTERVLSAAPGDAFDPFAAAPSPAGLEALLRREEYARLLWWPQRGVNRFVLWSARRMTAADYDPATTGAPDALRALPYSPLEPIAGSTRVAQLAAAAALGALGGWRPALRRALGAEAGGAAVTLAEAAGARAAEAQLIRAFLPPAAPRPFRDAWHRALPMDQGVSEALLPTSFTELWVPLERAADAMQRLRALYAGVPSAAGHFAVELYAASASPFWLGPSYGGPALRVNPFWYDRTPDDPRDEVFARLWAALADVGYRLHWGKALPDDAHASARCLARRYPRWHDFHRVRAALDPDGVFVTDYWRAHLGLDEPAAVVASRASQPPSQPPPPAAPPRVPLRRATFLREPPARAPRWPLLFALEPADESLLETAEQTIDAQAVTSAPPDAAYALFRDVPGSLRWMPALVRVEPRVPALEGLALPTFDETYAFMSLRLRITHERPGEEWRAVVDACSLPLATRLIQRARFEPARRGGGTRVRWRVAFDVPPALHPAAPAVVPLFRAWFARGLARFARLADERAAAARKARTP